MNKSEQIRLVMDTSLGGAAAALINTDGEILWEAYDHRLRVGGQALASLVEAGLADVGLGARSIGEIVVSNGPGSFTGIKIGLAFTYGFVACHESTKVIAGSALDCGTQAWCQGDLCAFFLPSTRTHGFVSRWSKAMASDCQLVRADELAAQTVEYGASVFGLRGAAQYWKLDGLPGDLTWVDIADFHPVALRGLNQAANSAVSDGLPEPRYLRWSTAEEKLGRRFS